MNGRWSHAGFVIGACVILASGGCGVVGESDSFSWTRTLTDSGSVEVAAGTATVGSWRITSSGVPLHTAALRVEFDVEPVPSDAIVTVEFELHAIQSSGAWSTDIYPIRLPQPESGRNVRLAIGVAPRACDSTECVDVLEMLLVRNDGDTTAVVRLDWNAGLVLEGAVEGAQIPSSATVELVSRVP